MLNSRTKFTATPRRAPRTWLAGLAVSSLVLTACGGGGDEDEGGADAASSEDLIPITIRSTGPTFTDLATLVMVQEDLFTEVGLDADFEFITASNAATAVQGLIAGEADVASGGAGAIYNAYAEGATELVVLGTANPSITFGLACNNEAVEQMAEDGVTPDSPVEERVQALSGLQLASSPAGSTGQKYLRTMLSEYGVDPDSDVTIVPNADNFAQLAATREGRVACFANSFPNTNLPEADGWGTLWLNWAADLPSLVPLAAHEYYTTQTWLDENPEAATRLMEALWLSLEALQDPSDELKESIKNMEGMSDLNPEGFDLGWDLSVEAYQDATPLTTQEMFDKQLDLLNFGRAEAPIDIAFEELYDLSAAEEAQP